MGTLYAEHKAEQNAILATATQPPAPMAGGFHSSRVRVG